MHVSQECKTLKGSQVLCCSCKESHLFFLLSKLRSRTTLLSPVITAPHTLTVHTDKSVIRNWLSLIRYHSMGLEEHSVHFILKLSCIICNVAIWRHVYRGFQTSPWKQSSYLLSLTHYSPVVTTHNVTAVMFVMPSLLHVLKTKLWCEGTVMGAAASRKASMWLSSAEPYQNVLLRLNNKRHWNADSFTELYADTSRLHSLAFETGRGI
jgi:hypothetical protein